MTHTIKDILREQHEEYCQKCIQWKSEGGFQTDLGFEYTLAADWLKAHDQKLLQAVVDTARGMQKEEYVYETDNEEHNDFESSLDFLETMGEAHVEGFNSALDDLIASITPIK